MDFRQPFGRFLEWTLVTFFAASCLHAQDALPRQQASMARHSMVATVHPMATEAGLRALERGGNAVDAAVAAALMLGVVDGFNSGIGGGCFILVRSADGALTAIDGRETAPAAAFREMYFRDGKPDPQLSQHGPLAIAVPGALAAYAEAVRDLGRSEFSQMLLDAAAVADRGFPIDHQYAAMIWSERHFLQRYDACRKLFFRDEREPLMAGDWLVQPDLANTYRAIAQYGCEWFYGGPFAEMTATWMAANGGLLTREDFARYQSIRRQPLVTRYRDHVIVGFPPPSSGGVHVAQILNVLESFDLRALYQQDPSAAIHVISEAMKLAFADRAHYLGDPAFTDVPRGLIDKAYARSLASRIDLASTLEVSAPGDPGLFDPRSFEKHTTHIAAADAEGNWVAITTTVNTTFGSKVIVPGLGVILNNQMDDFAIAPGVPNAFGLIGNDANAIAPGKRPLSSMSPTIVLRDDQPVLTIGAAGGPKIITQVVLGLIGYLDLEMSIEAAIAQARFHHQWSPPRLFVERGADADIMRRLEERGHQIEWTGPGGVTQAIARRDGWFYGAADPRAGGVAAGR